MYKRYRTLLILIHSLIIIQIHWFPYNVCVWECVCVTVCGLVCEWPVGLCPYQYLLLLVIWYKIHILKFYSWFWIITNHFSTPLFILNISQIENQTNKIDGASVRLFFSSRCFKIQKKTNNDNNNNHSCGWDSICYDLFGYLLFCIRLFLFL